ncbi:MAG: hypothetical protein ACXAEX_16750 [Promethearchaeota archaeon]|jgi:Na+/melibiose symporter-like transporter
MPFTKIKGLPEEDRSYHKILFNQKASFGLNIAGTRFLGATIDGAMLKYYTDFVLFPALWFDNNILTN